MRDGRLLRGRPIVGANFEGYQLGVPALNTVAISIIFIRRPCQALTFHPYKARPWKKCRSQVLRRHDIAIGEQRRGGLERISMDHNLEQSLPQPDRVMEAHRTKYFGERLGN